MDRQETITDIIAEMRALSNPISDGIIAIDGRSIADRLDAAHRREHGNAAKLREALEYMFILIDGRHLVLECETTEEISGVQGKLAEARAALAAPPRNCDVGSAKEQAKRLDAFCDSHGHGFDGQKCYSCENCKLISIDRCELAWAQMPYEEGGAK